MRRSLLGLVLLIAGVAVAVIALLESPEDLDSAEPQRTNSGGEYAPPQLESPTGMQAARSEQVPSIEVLAAGEPIADAASVSPESASISGTVLIKGAPPGEPFVLCLWAEGDGFGPELARIDVSADGAFAFEGLEAGFRGRIQLPVRFIVAGSQPRRRAIPVEAPSEGMSIEVERVPCLTGKLAARSTGEPVDDANLQVILTKADGGGMGVGCDLVPGGRFYVATPASQQLAAVAITVSSPSGWRGKFEFSSDEIPPDLDLGVLLLDAGSVLHLVVLDPERKALEGARALARGIGAPFVETDSEGRATLTGLEPGSQVTVLARGFDPALLEAPAAESTLEVVLERANRLTVRVLAPGGSPVAGVRLQLSAEAPPFVGTEYAPDEFLVPHIPKRGATTGQEVNRKRFFSWFVTDASGTVALQSLVPGLPLTLLVEDELDSVALEQGVPPLRTQEIRELDLRLPELPRCLSGVVVDRSGQPVDGAPVRLAAEWHDTQTQTDADGAFQFDALFATQADLTVELNGFLAVKLQDVPIEDCADPLRIVLEPGRDARVRVVDEFGATVVQGTLSARLQDGEQGWTADNPQDGYRRLTMLPFRDLDLRFDLAGRQFHATLGAHQEQAEMVVPACGQLEVRCRRPVHAGQHFGVRLVGGGSEPVEQFGAFSSERDSLGFVAVLPGSYELQCLTWLKDAERSELVPHGEPVTVEVTAGTTERVELQ
jgi:hypothetical protein